MNKFERLVYKLKNGNNDVKAESLFTLITSEPTDFEGCNGYNLLAPKGGIIQIHNNSLMVIIWRVSTSSYYWWNAHIIEGIGSNEPKSSDIQAKLDYQDETFVEGFIMFNSMEAL